MPILAKWVGSSVRLYGTASFSSHCQPSWVLKNLKGQKEEELRDAKRKKIVKKKKRQFFFFFPFTIQKRIIKKTLKGSYGEWGMEKSQSRQCSSQCMECLKLNVDGASKGKECYRMEVEKFCVLFSGLIGSKEWSDTEVQPISEAMRIFKGKFVRKLTRERDLKHTIKWVSRKSQMPWWLLFIIREIWAL